MSLRPDKPQRIIPPQGGSSTAPPKKLSTLFKFACGHDYELENILQKPCRKCQHEAREKENQRRQAAKKQRLQNQQRKFAAWVGKVGINERLPQGAWKSITWTGSIWIGTLHLPVSTEVFAARQPNQSWEYVNGQDFLLFHAEAQTERECCHQLHQLYLKWKRASEKLVVSKDVSG